MRMDAQITFRSEQRLTQDEFFEWLQQQPNLIGNYELIHGRIVMTPPVDLIHAGTGAELTRRLGNHVASLGLGRVYDASAGFDLPSGDTLEPDVSFVSKERLAAAPPVERGRFGKVVPDLVVEVLSRSTARRDRTEKKAIYAANGVREYWIVDPDRRAVTVFHLRGKSFDAGAQFSAASVTSEILPGLAIELGALFEI